MKKLIILLSLFTLAFSVNARDTTTGKLTVREVYEDAKTGFKDAFYTLKETASKLEGPAKHVYKLYIRQHRISAISMLCAMLLLLSTGTLLLMLHWRKADFGENNAADATPNSCMPSIIGVLLTIMGIILSVVFFVDTSFAKLINPEYYAIQDIIKAFK